MTTGRILELLLRFILAAAFLLAGTIKAKDPIQFLFDIRSFHLLDDPYAAMVAMGLPWLELLCAAGVLLKRLYVGSLTLICGSLVVFIVAIAWSWHRGLDISCGCYGKSQEELTYGWHIARNTALLVVGLGLLWREWWLGRARTSQP
jgi:putative oxidoreductase